MLENNKLFKLNTETINRILFYVSSGYKFFALINKQKNSYYLFIPDELSLSKKGSYIKLASKKKTKIFFLYYHLMTKFLKNLGHVFVKRLFLKGLGFRINLFEKAGSTFLRLKVGFSHIIDLYFNPGKVNIFINKNLICVKGEDIIFLNNFCKNIKNLKKPNAFNGKGFWYKNQKIVYKSFKKK
jgi:ribosomal protein L6P/L9E